MVIARPAAPVYILFFSSSSKISCAAPSATLISSSSDGSAILSFFLPYSLSPPYFTRRIHTESPPLAMDSRGTRLSLYVITWPATLPTRSRNMGNFRFRKTLVLSPARQTLAPAFVRDSRPEPYQSKFSSIRTMPPSSIRKMS